VSPPGAVDRSYRFGHGRNDRRGAKQAGFYRADRKISNKHFDLLANNLRVDWLTRETFPGISATTQVTAVNP